MSAETASSETFPTAPGMADYDAIFTAVMETERGRWFLAEYARHNRRVDTAEVLAAIDRLAAMMHPAVARPLPDATPRGEFGGDFDRIRTELADMANAIARTKDEIASIHPDAARGGRIMEATEQLDSVMRTTERATSEILAAAEQVQEVAWTMREQGMESEFCDRLDGYATEIYTACSFQDLTGQRTRKIIQVLRYLEARIQAMTSSWGTTPHAKLPATAKAERTSPANHIGRNPLDSNPLDLLMSLHAALPDAPPTVRPPVVKPVADAQHKALPLPATAPASTTKSTLTIEGPAGSFSILAGRTVGPEGPHAVPDFDAITPRAETDPLAAGLRAFAASLLAECRKEAAAPEDKPLAIAPPAPPERSLTPVPAPAPLVIGPLPTHHSEVVLPLAMSPPLGDLPQRPAPEPARPARKSDIAEELFADVMALTDEERIALFT